MTQLLRALLLLAALGTAARTLSGQAAPPLAQGSRVRVRTLGDTGLLDRGVEGTVERLSGDTLILRPRSGGASRVFLAGEESQLFVYSGRHSHLARGAVIGGIAGLFAGGVVGAASGEVCEGTSTLCFDRKVVAFKAAALLAAVGTVGGLIVGTLTSHDAWTRSARLASVRPLASVGAHGMTLGLSTTF